MAARRNLLNRFWPNCERPDIRAWCSIEYSGLEAVLGDLKLLIPQHHSFPCLDELRRTSDR